MYKVVLPFFLIVIGIILCLNRNYPANYMSTPSYPKQTMNAHFVMINMIKETESKIKQKPINTFYLTEVGIVFILAGSVLAVIFYFI